MGFVLDCEHEIVYTQEELTSVANQLIQHSDGMKVWIFDGEMGAGKTTLIKEICKNFGVKETVSSPTYSLINEYHDDKGNGYFHFDFYRIKTEDEASDIGSDEYFYSGEYCFVEWPSKIPSLLPNNYYSITMEVEEDGKRKICLIKKKA